MKINTFQILDAQFKILDSHSFSARVKAFDTIANNGYVVLTDSIYVLDEQLEVVRATHGPGSFHHVISTNNGYWLFNTLGEILNAHKHNLSLVRFKIIWVRV